MTPQKLTLILRDPAARRVFGAVVLGARTSSEILRASGLPAAEAAPAIGQLTRSGLLRSDGPGQLGLDEDWLRQAAEEAAEQEAAAEEAAARRAAQEQPDPRLRGYIRFHELLALPDDSEAAFPVLAEVATATFTPGTPYPEKTVNDLLADWCQEGQVDVVSLRRALVDARLLDRTSGEYRYRPPVTEGA